jgi:hypothetical protein
MNIIYTGLWTGASVEMMDTGRFNPVELWGKLLTEQGLNVFMAVPTIYQRLLATYKDVPVAVQAHMPGLKDVSAVGLQSGMGE